VFVEAPNRNARFLHNIGDADTFKSALAKPLGGHVDLSGQSLPVILVG